jgi:hypothetical protein
MTYEDSIRSTRPLPPSIPQPALRIAHEDDRFCDPPQDRVKRPVFPLGGFDLFEVQVGEGIVLHDRDVPRSMIRWGSELLAKPTPRILRVPSSVARFA